MAKKTNSELLTCIPCGGIGSFCLYGQAPIPCRDCNGTGMEEVISIPSFRSQQAKKAREKARAKAKVRKSITLIKRD